MYVNEQPVSVFWWDFVGKPGAVIAIPSYSIFRVATPTIPNGKIDLAGLRGMIDSIGRFEGSVPGDCSASAGTTSHDGIGPRVANLAKGLRLGGRARGGQRVQKRITRLRRRLLAFVIKANPECFDHDGRLVSGRFPARIPPEATDLHGLMRRSGMQTRHDPLPCGV